MCADRRRVLANMVGPLIGAFLEKKKGNSPVKGAIFGSLIQSTVRTAVSLAATAAVGYALKKVFDKVAPAQAPTPSDQKAAEGSTSATA